MIAGLLKRITVAKTAVVESTERAAAKKVFERVMMRSPGKARWAGCWLSVKSGEDCRAGRDDRVGEQAC